MSFIHKFDLSGEQALYGLYYMAVTSSGKVINLSFEDIKSFLEANAQRNMSLGIHPGMVNACHGYFIGVNVAHSTADVTEYDKYYGEGAAEKAFDFARAMKKARS